VWHRPSAKFISGMQHFAAGRLFGNADSALLSSLAYQEHVRCYDSSTDWPCRRR